MRGFVDEETARRAIERSDMRVAVMTINALNALNAPIRRDEVPLRREVVTCSDRRAAMARVTRVPTIIIGAALGLFVSAKMVESCSGPHPVPTSLPSTTIQVESTAPFTSVPAEPRARSMICAGMSRDGTTVLALTGCTSGDIVISSGAINVSGTSTNVAVPCESRNIVPAVGCPLVYDGCHWLCQ